MEKCCILLSIPAAAAAAAAAVPAAVQLIISTTETRSTSTFSFFSGCFLHPPCLPETRLFETQVQNDLLTGACETAKHHGPEGRKQRLWKLQATGRGV